MLLYLAQEGRGIGLLDKLRAYSSRSRGSTRSTQHRARPAGRFRELRHGRQILGDLGLGQHPGDDQQPEEARGPRGIRPDGHRAGADRAAQPGEREYLHTKVKQMGHTITHQGRQLDTFVPPRSRKGRWDRERVRGRHHRGAGRLQRDCGAAAVRAQHRDRRVPVQRRHRAEAAGRRRGRV